MNIWWERDREGGEGRGEGGRERDRARDRGREFMLEKTVGLCSTDCAGLCAVLLPRLNSHSLSCGHSGLFQLAATVLPRAWCTCPLCPLGENYFGCLTQAEPLSNRVYTYWWLVGDCPVQCKDALKNRHTSLHSRQQRMLSCVPTLLPRCGSAQLEHKVVLITVF